MGEKEATKVEGLGCAGGMRRLRMPLLLRRVGVLPRILAAVILRGGLHKGERNMFRWFQGDQGGGGDKRSGLLRERVPLLCIMGD